MKMKTMSSALLIAGAVWISGSSASIAAPIDASAIRAAADEVGIGETVHCRPFRHWHRWGYGRGCRGGVVIYDRGPRVRYGVSVRDGYRTRAGVSVRERTGVTIRGEERSTIRSGTRDGMSVRGSNTIRSGGAAGEISPRGATSGGQMRTGAGAGTGGGGRMNTAPAGQTQGQGSQGGQVPGTQGGAGGGGSQKQ